MCFDHANVLVTATGQAIGIYDQRMKVGQVQTYSMNSQLMFKQQTMVPVSSVATSLHMKNSRLYVATTSFIDEIDLRNLRTSNIFQSQMPFQCKFSSIGATVLQ